MPRKKRILASEFLPPPAVAPPPASLLAPPKSEPASSSRALEGVTPPAKPSLGPIYQCSGCKALYPSLIELRIGQEVEGQLCGSCMPKARDALTQFIVVGT